MNNNTARKEYIAIKTALVPGGEFSTDVIKQITVIPSKGQIIVGGDFVCFNIIGADKIISGDK